MGKRRRKSGGDVTPAVPEAEDFPATRAEIEVDGSMHEGGGQMVRTSIGLGAALGVSCEVNKIRAGRSKPGLRAQHIAGARLAAKLGINGGGRLHGAALNSTKLRFEPGKCHDDNNANGNISIDIGTAGATSLVLQATLPAIIEKASSSKDSISYRINGGGTHVPFSPTADYISLVLIPIAKNFGIDIKYDVHRQGFFPRGGAQVSVSVGFTKPGLSTPLPWVQLQRGKVTRVYGIIVIGHNSLRAAAESLRKGVRKALRKRLGDDFENLKLLQKEEENNSNNVFEVKEQRAENGGPSLALTLVAETEDTNGLYGRLGRSQILDAKSCREAGYASVDEGVGEMGAAEVDALVDDLASGACVDAYMADQIMPMMALAQGTSRVRVPAVSLHMRSMQEVLARFGLDIRFEEKVVHDGSTVTEMVCDGRKDERS